MEHLDLYLDLDLGLSDWRSWLDSHHQSKAPVQCSRDAFASGKKKASCMESATRHKSACLHRSCAQPMPGYDLQLLAAFMTINSKDSQFQGSPSGIYVERMSTNAAKLLHSLPCGSCPRGPLSYTPCNAKRDTSFFTPYTELIYSVQWIAHSVQYNELRTPYNELQWIRSRSIYQNCVNFDW